MRQIYGNWQPQLITLPVSGLEAIEMGLPANKQWDVTYLSWLRWTVVVNVSERKVSDNE